MKQLIINFKNHHVCVNRKLFALYLYSFYGVGGMSSVINMLNSIEKCEIVDEKQLGLLVVGDTSAQRSANLLSALNHARTVYTAKLQKYICGEAKRGCWALK